MKTVWMQVYATPADLTEMHIRHMIADCNSSMGLSWMDGC
jgi:hypothetical protein